MELSDTGPTPAYSDIRLNADRVIAGLADSDDPTICAHCFLKLGVSLVHNQSCLQRLRAERHELFDSCMSVIFTWSARHKDDEFLPTLVRNISRCPIPTHLTEPAQAAVIAQAIYTSAYTIVTIALGKGANAPSERANSNKNFSDRAGRWPSQMGQLFPLGEQETVVALLVAAETDTRTYGPISLLIQLLSIARTIVWPVLVSERHRRRVLLTIIALLAPPTKPDSPPWLGYNGILALVTSLLGKIRVGPDSRVNDMEQLIGDDAEILYDALTSALDMVPDSSEGALELALWCHAIYHSVPRGTLLEPSERAVQWIQAALKLNQQSLEPVPDTELDLALSLEVAVARFMRLRACACCGISSLRMDDGKALSFCAGCKLVLYCSKSCQRQHWNGKGGCSAHKAVCPILRRIDGSSKYHDPPELVAALKKLMPTLNAEEAGILRDWLFDTQRPLGGDSVILSS